MIGLDSEVQAKQTRGAKQIRCDPELLSAFVARIL